MFKYMLMIIKSIPLGIKRGDITIIVTVAILVTAILAPSVFDQGLRAAMSPLLEMKQKKLQQEEQKAQDQEQALLLKLKSVPVKQYKENLAGYKELLKLRPDNVNYSEKVAKYEGLIKAKKDKGKAEALRAKKAKTAAEKRAKDARLKAAALKAEKENLRQKRIAKERKAKEAARLAAFKKDLVHTKWNGDVILLEREKRYFTGTNITLKFKKDGLVEFNVNKDKTIERSDKRFNISMSAMFYSNKGKFKYSVGNNQTIKIKASGLKEMDYQNARWNPNQTWSAKVKGEKMTLSARGLTVDLVK